MYTAQAIIGIMLMTVGVTAFIVFVLLALFQEKGAWMIGCLIMGLGFILPGTLMYINTPTKRDVLNGNAHYVREVNYTEYDTITTYHLEFNEDYFLGKGPKKHKKAEK